MKILQLHSRYSGSKTSGENSTVIQIRDFLTEFAEVDSLILSTSFLQSSAFKKFRAAFHYLVPNFGIIKKARDKDLVIFHNPIPFVSALTLKIIIRKKPVIRVWHNYRSSCIAGTHFRNKTECTLCLDSSFGVLNGIKNRCYRNSLIQSVMVTWNEKTIRKIQNSNNFYHIAISRNIRDHILSLGIDDRQVFMITNHVQDLMQFRETVEKKGNNFLFLGRLEEQKGVDIALQSWLTIPKAILGNSVFFVVGDGPQLTALRERYEGDSIIFYPNLDRDQIAELSEICSVGIIPSVWSEPFGKVLLEYMSLGLRQIVSPRGDLPFLAMPFPDGITVEEVSVEEIKSAMICHLKNPVYNPWKIRSHFLKINDKNATKANWEKTIKMICTAETKRK